MLTKKNVNVVGKMLPMIRFKLKIKKHVVMHNKFRCVWNTVQNTNRFITCNKCSLTDTMSTVSVRSKQITSDVKPQSNSL
jgi:hypothetical protein